MTVMTTKPKLSKQQFARRLALSYVVTTERFDLSVCTDRDSNGFGKPANSYEMKASSTYANEMRRQYTERLGDKDMMAFEIRQALRWLERSTTMEFIEAELERLGGVV